MLIIKRNKGFTLVEMVVCLVIISILIAFTSVALNRYMKRSKKKMDIETCKEWEDKFSAAAQDKYIANYGTPYGFIIIPRRNDYKSSTSDAGDVHGLWWAKRYTYGPTDQLGHGIYSDGSSDTVPGDLSVGSYCNFCGVGYSISYQPNVEDIANHYEWRDNTADILEEYVFNKSSDFVSRGNKVYFNNKLSSTDNTIAICGRIDEYGYLTDVDVVVISGSIDLDASHTSEISKLSGHDYMRTLVQYLYPDLNISGANKEYINVDPSSVSNPDNWRNFRYDIRRSLCYCRGVENWNNDYVNRKTGKLYYELG